MKNGKPKASCFANGLAKKDKITVPTTEIIKALKIEPHDVPSKSMSSFQGLKKRMIK